MEEEIKLFNKENEEFNFKKILLIIILVFFIASGTSYLVLELYTTESGAEEDEEQVGPYHSLGDFVVNLSTGNRQFLRVSIVVELDTEEVTIEIEEKTPRIQDTINSTLRAQELEHIEEPGTPVLKNELKGELNQILNKGQITEIWFTEILVQ